MSTVHYAIRKNDKKVCGHRHRSKIAAERCGKKTFGVDNFEVKISINGEYRLLCW
jgi:hypothetical protein